MKAYTDYPFRLLGDTPHQEAPIRECEVLEYDGDKYATIRCEGRTFTIKAGYVYSEPTRVGWKKPFDMTKLST